MTSASHKIGRHGGGVPPTVFLAGAGLVCLTVAAAGVAHTTGEGAQRLNLSEPVAIVQLRFEDGPNGSVEIRNARSHQLVSVVAPGTGGFIRSTMRGLVRERKRNDVGAGPPFRLTRWSDGTLSLDDETTGRHIALDAFGTTNARVFASLVEQGGMRQ